MAVKQHLVDKMIKGITGGGENKHGCVRRIHTGFWGCLLGILSGRIVRSYSRCFWG